MANKTVIKLVSRPDLSREEREYMKPIIVQQLLDKILVHAEPSGKLATVYHSPVYKIWHFIFDAEGDWLKHWIVCRLCKEVKFIVTGNTGTGKLKNHACFKAENIPGNNY